MIYGDSPGVMIKEVLNKSGFIQDLSRNINIAIKPNLVLAKKSESGATTSPELIEGIIEFLQENNFFNIKILESSWLGDKTSRAFSVCGYDEISKKYNVPLIDLKKDDFENFSYEETNIRISKSILKTDFLINVPVLKAHCQTKLTCSLKNLKGCIPDKEKRNFHAMGLHKPIAYLNKAIKTGLVIVDGIIGDLTFEEGGNPVQMNRIIVGKDPVLVDAYACELLGYSPNEIDYIKEAEKLGIGKSDLNHAKITELNKEQYRGKKLDPGKKVQELACWIDDREACSACYGSLIHALEKLQKKGKLKNINKTFAIGQGYKNKTPEGPGIGSCTKEACFHIEGCPPEAGKILRQIEEDFDKLN